MSANSQYYVDMPAPAKFSFSYMCDAALCCALAVTDFSMTYGGPVYVFLGMSLICGVSYLYLMAIFVPLYASQGWPVGGAHLALGSILLGNILFNYVLCIKTPPGTTAKCVREGYHLAAGMNARFCKTCKRAKPPLTHHCHICKLCVLKMDHHCPWVHNCIGFYNHRYFVLFVFYLCLGSLYAAVSMWKRLVGPYPPMQPRVGEAMVLAFAMSASAAFVLAVLFLWHCYLIVTAQSTIDFLNNWKEKRLCAKAGIRWHNPHDHGVLANWKVRLVLALVCDADRNILSAQPIHRAVGALSGHAMDHEAFDAQGRFWWIDWAWPTLQKKHGNPAQFLGSQQAQLYKGLPVSSSARSDEIDAMV